MSDNNKLEGKVALITGAGGGQGRAAAPLFASEEKPTECSLMCGCGADIARYWRDRANAAHKLTLPERVPRNYSGGANLAADANEVGSPGHRPAEPVNRLKFETWSADILALFPMCDMQPQRGHFIAQDFWPLVHGKTFLGIPAAYA